MARVEVDIEDAEADEAQAEDAVYEEPSEGSRRRSRGGGGGPDIEVEREITKRQVIQSISSIVVVILYMLFTLLRDRDAGVVVIDDEGPQDDWE